MCMELYALIFQFVECIGIFLLTSLTVAGIFSVCDLTNFRANECRAKLV